MFDRSLLSNYHYHGPNSLHSCSARYLNDTSKQHLCIITEVIHTTLYGQGELSFHSSCRGSTPRLRELPKIPDSAISVYSLLLCFARPGECGAPRVRSLCLRVLRIVGLWVWAVESFGLHVLAMGDCGASGLRIQFRVLELGVGQRLRFTCCFKTVAACWNVLEAQVPGTTSN